MRIRTIPYPLVFAEAVCLLSVSFCRSRKEALSGEAYRRAVFAVAKGRTVGCEKRTSYPERKIVRYLVE
jgi:hypothetical protein